MPLILFSRPQAKHPRRLFFKAKRRDAAGTGDLFADSPKVEKEIRHAGYTDKAGVYHQPHMQRHEVRVEPKAPSNPVGNQGHPKKEPWQMTLAEFKRAHPPIQHFTPDTKSGGDPGLRGNSRTGYQARQALGDAWWSHPLTNVASDTKAQSARVAHRRAIEQALAAGNTVPAEVLADYPDMDKDWAIPRQAASNPAAPQVPASARMKVYGWDPVRLADAYSMDELMALRERVEAEHANPLDDKGHPLEGGKPTLRLFNAKGRKKLDALAWAVRYKLEDARSGSAAQPDSGSNGPIEGDTKTENGKTYTLRDGRWHLDTPELASKPVTPAPAAPANLLKLRAKIEDMGGRQKTAETMKTALRGRDTKAKASALIDSLAEATGASRDQVLAELGLKQVEKPVGPAPKPRPAAPAQPAAPFDDLDPSSPNYRYRDTGYVAGSRKEAAAGMLRQAKRDGAQVRKNAIDWEMLEQNPREAREVITKSHLFGSVDWEGLKAGGMEPAAGFLVDRVYAAVGTAPTDDSPQARQDYVLGLESLRDRLERCKNADEVTRVLGEIRDEWEGVNLNEAEAAEYADLGERIRQVMRPVVAFGRERDRLGRVWQDIERLSAPLEFKKRRTPAEDADLAALKERKQAAWDAQRQFIDDHPQFQNKPHSTPGGGLTAYSDAEIPARQARAQQETIVAAAKVRNTTENSIHRAWAQMGEGFVRVLRYRSSKGSDAFAKHVANAKGGRVTDWSWAEKAPKPAQRGASEESVRFQLLVADKYERKGGRPVKAGSTEALKQAFGLREVQSGNWVLRDVNSAKFHTEQTAGAFADLADLVGVPDTQVSMNGRLALAFGARGRGNAGFGGAARAHYEPVERVINLTKMGGGGTLAHEWFHALDNLLSEAQGGTSGKDTFLTKDPSQVPAGELRDAFASLRSALLAGPHRLSSNVDYTGEDYRLARRNIVRDHLPEGAREYGMLTPAKLIRAAGNVHAAVQAVDDFFAKRTQTKKNAGMAKQWRTLAAAHYGGDPHGGTIAVEAGPAMSEFAREAVFLDQGRNGKYWSSPKEMAARAFQGWAEDRLAAQGRRNDYLSAKADNRFYAGMNAKPFPEGPERERLNAAFDRLMGVISTGDLLAKALARLARPRLLPLKSRGWFGPEHGGTHIKQEGQHPGGGGSALTLPSSAGLATLAEASAYWRAHLGGKTMALTVHSGGKEFPVKVRFDAGTDHAYTDSRDDVGAKLSARQFSAKRAHAMARIPSVIEYPQRRLKNHGADLLLEGKQNGEHYTIVLTWKDGAQCYDFNSAHFRSAREVLRLQRQRDTRKNNGPLQKSEPFGAGPSDFKVPYGSRVYPADSQPRGHAAPARNCQDSIAPRVLFFKALPGRKRKARHDRPRRSPRSMPPADVS